MKEPPEEIVQMVGIYLEGMINILINQRHEIFDFKNSNVKKLVTQAKKQKRI